MIEIEVVSNEAGIEGFVLLMVYVVVLGLGTSFISLVFELFNR